MSRLTDLVFKVLRIQAGDTPAEVKEAIIHPTQNKRSTPNQENEDEDDKISTFKKPNDQKKNGHSNLAKS